MAKQNICLTIFTTALLKPLILQQYNMGFNAVELTKMRVPDISHASETVDVRLLIDINAKTPSGR